MLFMLTELNYLQVTFQLRPNRLIEAVEQVAEPERCDLVDGIAPHVSL